MGRPPRAIMACSWWCGFPQRLGFKRCDRTNSRLSGVLVVVAGVGIAAQVAPMLPAALYRGAAEPPGRSESASPPPDRVAALSRAAIRWHGSATDLRRLARVAQAENRVAAARRLLSAALRRTPGDDVAWTRLAVLRHTANAPNASADALAMALRVAPGTRHLADVRAELILRNWPAIRRRVDSGRLHRHLRLAASATESGHLRRVARSTGREAVLRTALAAHARPPPPARRR